MHTLPRMVTKLTAIHDAWIVGSAAAPDVEKPRDYDIVVPFHKWNEVAQLIPIDAKPNTFGGWKFKDEGDTEVDVWPDDLGRVMTAGMAQYAWQPRYRIRLKKESE